MHDAGASLPNPFDAPARRRAAENEAVMRLSQPHDLTQLLRESLAAAEGDEAAAALLARRAQAAATRAPRVFIAYVVEDTDLATKLCQQLEDLGFDPWMDRRSLLPGEHWLRAIDAAIESSRFFIACLSSRSVDKRSRFQAELRYALDCATLLPHGDIFFIPVRFDDCRVPLTIARTIQYVDLFPDWNRGLRRILKMACEQLLRDLPPDTEKGVTPAEPE